MSDELPPELSDLEARLAARPAPQPHATHRQSVLQAVRRELRQGSSRRLARAGLWRFAAATAAACFVCVNLSMSAVNSAGANFSYEDGSEDGRDCVQRIRELLPDLSDAEARRQALVWRAGARLVRTPRPAGVPHSAYNRRLEDESWTTH